MADHLDMDVQEASTLFDGRPANPSCAIETMQVEFYSRWSRKGVKQNASRASSSIQTTRSVSDDFTIGVLEATGVHDLVYRRECRASWNHILVLIR